MCRIIFCLRASEHNRLDHSSFICTSHPSLPRCPLKFYSIPDLSTSWTTDHRYGLELDLHFLDRSHVGALLNAPAVLPKTNIVMTSIRIRKRALFLAITTLALFTIIANFFLLSDTDIKSQLESISLPELPGLRSKGWHSGENLDDSPEPVDDHPISLLIKEADKTWRAYEDDRSITFRQTVSRYRRKYGRHPPPGFKEWYQFARKKNVHNIDDFEQIMDDLRPFWAVEPRIIRNLAANMWRDKDQGVAGIHIRDHKVVNVTNGSWRSETLVTLIEKLIKYLPDMDIAMNRLDQPRVVVPWRDMQAHLAKELETRQTPPEAIDEYTSNMEGFLNITVDDDGKPKEDPEWYPAHGGQYMDIASQACPPESHARNNRSTTYDTEALYKNRFGGIITNFNRTSDLCTVGPEIRDKHGLLYSSASLIPTKRLVPIFGECKVNVNSDILFPANMYWKHDERYDYSGKHDLDWDKKREVMIWRGVSSGGTQLKENWQRMHRQRLVMLLNATEMEGKEVRILAEQPERKGAYENFRQFHPSEFAANHTDVGFTETWGCIPDGCPFYENVFSLKEQISLSEQFQSKFLVDVDGHSFSGRWHAFLESKSLGIKATIFREWHDSRLFAWRHFVPMDNRYDDMYSILTYFIGLDKAEEETTSDDGSIRHPSVARHDREAKRLADQGREWAKKVLRREDIEVSSGTFHVICPIEAH